MGGFLIKMTYRITQPCLPERQTGTEQKKNYIQANNLHSNLNGLDNFTTILLLLMMRFNQDDSHFIHDCLKFLQSGHLKSPKIQTARVYDSFLRAIFLNKVIFQ